MLTDLGGVGAPEEYLLLTNLKKRFGTERIERILFTDSGIVDIKDYVLELTKEKTGKEAPLGLVLQSTQMHNIGGITGVSTIQLFQRLYKLFGNPVAFLLQREDLAKQAVSLYFLYQSGIAHSYQKNSAKEETYSNIAYDEVELLKWYHFAQQGYQFWRSLLSHCGITPVYISYEDLRGDVYATIRKMSEEIGYTLPLSPSEVEALSKTGLRKLSISKKTDYATKFKQQIESGEFALRV